VLSLVGVLDSPVAAAGTGSAGKIRNLVSTASLARQAVKHA